VNRIAGSPLVYITGMATNSTLLCIHRDPAQLSSLKEQGYELVTATNGSDGLRLVMSQPVDAIVLDYHLGPLDGAAIADEIKQHRPEVPIVMLSVHLELPYGALKSVDALVTKSDGAHFLLATVHFMLNVKPAQRCEGKLRAQTPAPIRRLGRSREGTARWEANAPQLATDENTAPFSPWVWRAIRNGRVEF
jgi:DNA-binding response OmpR family regulator